MLLPDGLPPGMVCTPLPRQNDWQTLLKTLPTLAVGNEFDKKRSENNIALAFVFAQCTRGLAMSVLRAPPITPSFPSISRPLTPDRFKDIWFTKLHWTICLIFPDLRFVLTFSFGVFISYFNLYKTDFTKSFSSLPKKYIFWLTRQDLLFSFYQTNIKS